MYGKTADQTAFRERTASHSTKGSRRGFDLLDQGENAAAVLTRDQQRSVLVQRVHWISAQMQGLKPRDPQRVALGQMMLRTQLEISELRPKIKGPQNIEGFFVDVCRERLSAFQFKTLMNEAHKLAEKMLGNTIEEQS